MGITVVSLVIATVAFIFHTLLLMRWRNRHVPAVKSMKAVNMGLILQAVYILFHLSPIRAAVLSTYGIEAVAYVELALIVAGLLLGIIGLLLRNWSRRTVFIVFFGIISCLWFTGIYLLPESDIPPALPWLYKS